MPERAPGLQCFDDAPNDLHQIRAKLMEREVPFPIPVSVGDDEGDFRRAAGHDATRCARPLRPSTLGPLRRKALGSTHEARRHQLLANVGEIGSRPLPFQLVHTCAHRRCDVDGRYAPE